MFMSLSHLWLVTPHTMSHGPLEWEGAEWAVSHWHLTMGALEVTSNNGRLITREGGIYCTCTDKTAYQGGIWANDTLSFPERFPPQSLKIMISFHVMRLVVILRPFMAVLWWWSCWLLQQLFISDISGHSPESDNGSHTLRWPVSRQCNISCSSLITWLLCNWLLVAIKGNSSTLAAWPDINWLLQFYGNFHIYIFPTNNNT